MPDFISYTSERRECFSLITSVYPDRVVKTPGSPAAEEHLNRMLAIDYTRLNGERILYVEPHKTGKGVEFPRIAGKSLAGMFDELLIREDTAAITELLSDYYAALKEDAFSKSEPFQGTDRFSEWFGSGYDLRGETAMPYSNVDLVLSNVFPADGVYRIIDPEWVFDFPIPLGYVKYRIANNIIIGHMRGKKDIGITEEMIRASFEIDPQMIKCFVKMDEHFNTKVFRSAVIEPKPVFLLNSNLKTEVNHAQIFLSDPPDENRSERIEIIPGNVRLNVVLSEDKKNIKSIRVDPSEISCIIANLTCRAVGKKGAAAEISFTTNATVSYQDLYVFANDDPQIYLHAKPRISEYVVTYDLLLTGNCAEDHNNTSVFDAISRHFEYLAGENQRISEAAIADRQKVEEMKQQVKQTQEYLESTLQHIEKLDEKLAESERQVRYYYNRTPRGVAKRIYRLTRRGASRVKRGFLYIPKAFRVMRTEGVGGFFSKFSRKLRSGKSKHGIPKPKVDGTVSVEPDIKFSVIMPVYNVDPVWLHKAVQSVMAQSYPNWQLCITDDCSTHKETVDYLKGLKDNRIVVRYAEKNGGISTASNMAASCADGKYLVLMDNDDEMDENALKMLAIRIHGTEADILYTDEDKVDINGDHRFPFFKPDWSPDLLMSQMYIGHIFCFRKDLFDSVGGFRSEFDGSQDYDLALRLTGITKKIEHVPAVLYSWREIPSSTASDPSAKPYSHTSGLKALDAHLKRIYGSGAHAEETENYFVYQPRFGTNAGQAFASIIIPMKDKSEMTDQCVRSIISKTTYPNYEILIVNNNSTQPETKKWLASIRDEFETVRVIDANFEFNWSKINNFAVSEARGDVLVFLNNDTLVISDDWLELLIENALRPDVGTVGALLLFEDDTIQHAGIVVGFGGWADHVFKGQKPVHFGSPFVSPVLQRNVSANTGACLAISKARFSDLGMFDERFIICGSDVELSIKATEKGFFNVYVPYAKLYHLESKSRDAYIPEVDFKISYDIYSPYREKGDPFYNNNLSYESTTPTVRPNE